MTRSTGRLKFDWTNPASYTDEPRSNPYGPDDLIGSDHDMPGWFDDLAKPLTPRDPAPDWPPPANSIPHLNGWPPKAPIEAPPPDRPPTWFGDPTPSRITGTGPAGEFSGFAPQPTPTMQNLTAHVLRMKGVPEADIGTVLNDPTQMQDLLNQLYGRRPMIAPGDDEDGFTGNAGRGPLAGLEQASTQRAATPDAYLPFGWAGLLPLLR